MAALLEYQADINGGHYALYTLQSGARETINVQASSYNNRELKPVRAYIGNYANPANITVTLIGGLQTVVPAYANNYVTIANNPVIEIYNPGIESIQIMVVDDKMIPFAEDTFATLTVGGSSSNNDILNHFNGTLSQNEGFLAGVGYTVGVNVNFSANVKFGESSINLKNAHGGLQIRKDGYFNIADDFCIDFWFYTPALPAGGVGDVLAVITSNSPTPQQAVMVCLEDSRIILRCDVNNAALPSSNAATYDVRTGSNAYTLSTWHHLALTKEGPAWKVFLDGTQILTLAKPLASVYDVITVGRYPNAFPANVYTGLIDELRVRWGSALWTAAFTPPTVPYD